jgi:hypothetical protein
MTYSYFAIAPFFIFLLIFLFISGAALGITARRARVARPDHFHWIVRILCAVLVVAALVAVGVGTWRGTSASLTSEPVLVTLPTKAPPPIPNAKKPNGRLDLGSTKLVGTVLLVRKLQDRFVPICGESLTLDWPPNGNPELAFQGESGGSSYTVRMHLGEFVRWNPDEAISASQGVSVQSRGKQWSRGGSMELKLDTLEVDDFGGFSEQLDHPPLSVIPVAAAQDLRLLVHLTRADRNDPLRQVAASDWLSGEAGNLRRDERNSHSSRDSQLDPTTPPGIRMLVFLGPSVILLLLAAAVGSALFPRGRRAVAFTGLLTGMVLYAGLLDAVILERRARVATDASQPEIVRGNALETMRRGTFFHPGKATARIRQIAADAATPAFVRSLAEGMGNGN